MRDGGETIPFHGPGIEAELAPHGPRCRLTITLDGRALDGANAVRLEVLFQPRNERGLPAGAPAVLYSSTWPLRSPGGPEPAVAEGWLPRALEPALAGRCYYRVVPTHIIIHPAHQDSPARGPLPCPHQATHPAGNDS